MLPHFDPTQATHVIAMHLEQPEVQQALALGKEVRTYAMDAVADLLVACAAPLSCTEPLFSRALCHFSFTTCAAPLS